MQVRQTEPEKMEAIVQAIEHQDVDRLRYYCKHGGLLDIDVRARAWPLLLHIDPKRRIADPKSLVKLHQYSGQIDTDVVRSLWHFVSDEEREEKRSELSAIINATISTSPELHYFQGFHDIASVFLIVCNNLRLSYSLLKRLSYYHIRDNMNPDMDCNIHVCSKDFIPDEEVVHQVRILLALVDPELAEFIKSAELQPYYGMSWTLTWFSHDIDDLNTISRIFDYFLASSPYAPVYLSVAVFVLYKPKIMRRKRDCTLYAYLSHLLLDHANMNWDHLVLKSEEYLTQFPPEECLSLPPPNSNMKSYPFYNMADSDVDSTVWLRTGTAMLVSVFGIALTTYVAGY